MRLSRKNIALACAIATSSVAVVHAALADDGPATAPHTLLEGPAIAIDGDTLDFAGRRVRIVGFDAPEMKGDTRGPKARAAMDALIRGEIVACRIEGQDRYHRDLATCAIQRDGRDLTTEMLRAGQGTHFRHYTIGRPEFDRWDAAEAEAKAAARGIWAAQPALDFPQLAQAIKDGTEKGPWDWAMLFATFVGGIGAAGAAIVALHIANRQRQNQIEDEARRKAEQDAIDNARTTAELISLLGITEIARSELKRDVEKARQELRRRFKDSFSEVHKEHFASPPLLVSGRLDEPWSKIHLLPLDARNDFRNLVGSLNEFIASWDAARYQAIRYHDEIFSDHRAEGTGKKETATQELSWASRRLYEQLEAIERDTDELLDAVKVLWKERNPRPPGPPPAEVT